MGHRYGNLLTKFLKVCFGQCVEDPHHIDADPDPAFHFDEDPEPDPYFKLMRIRIRICNTG
jgi:hypothetical protein